MKGLLASCILVLSLGPAAMADSYCHANLASADNSVVPGQTNITINFRVFRFGRIGYDSFYFASPIRIEVKNMSLSPGQTVKIHWIEGHMEDGQLKDAETTAVVALHYNSSRATFVGQLGDLGTFFGQKIVASGHGFLSATTYPNQIAVQIGENGWLDDALDHADRHNFNIDLGRAFIAQGGEGSNCFIGDAD